MKNNLKNLLTFGLIVLGLIAYSSKIMAAPITEEEAKSVIANAEFVTLIKVFSINKAAKTQVEITNSYTKLIEGESYQCFEAEVLFSFEKSKRVFDVEYGMIRRGKRIDTIILKIPEQKLAKWTFGRSPQKNMSEIDTVIKNFWKYAKGDNAPDITISYDLHENSYPFENAKQLLYVISFPYIVSAKVSVNNEAKDKYSGYVFFDAVTERWRLAGAKRSLYLGLFVKEFDLTCPVGGSKLRAYLSEY